MLRCSIAEKTSDRHYNLYFQVNQQSPCIIKGIPFKVYIRVKHNDDFAVRYIHHLIQLKILPDMDETIRDLWISIDGTVFRPLDLDKYAYTGPTVEEIADLNLKECSASQPSQSTNNLRTSPNGLKTALTKCKKIKMKKKKPSKSHVWTFFMNTKDGDICKLCQKNVKGSNTTNLQNHLMRNHKDIPEVKLMIGETVCNKLGSQHQVADHTYQDINEPDSCDSNFENESSSLTKDNKGQPSGFQPRIDNSVFTISSFKDSGSKANVLKNALIFMIAKDDMPLNTTEKVGFKYFMNVVAPLYKVPGRTSLTTAIERKYEVLSAIIKQKLTRIHHFTITADVWTETMTTKSFLGCTVHFLDGEKVTSLVLGVTELDERHSSAYLQKVFQSVCNNWNISLENMIAIVTDNGANLVKAAQDTFGASKHIACFAHSLNLALTKAINESEPLKDILMKVKLIVTYFKHSVPASDSLKKSQKTSLPLTLIQDVCTRWNSTYYMLNRFLELMYVVSTILLKIPNSPPMLTASEVAIAREIMDILRPAEIVSQELCGQKYVTCSKIIPLIACLKKAINGVQSASQIGAAFKRDLILELEKRFKEAECNRLIAIATVLDPRFKRLHFTNALPSAKAVEKINTLLVRSSSIGEVPKVHKSKATLDHDVWKFHVELINNGNNETKCAHQET